MPASQSLPAQIRAGDAFAWSVQTQLAAGLTLFYVLTAIVKNAPVRIAIPPVSIDVNLLASFSIASSVSAAWTPGKYQWVCFAIDGLGNRSEIAQGKIRIDPDVNGATAVDPRSDNERLLANIQALLQGKALDDAAMYKIGTRELTKMTIKDLLYWEAIIEARVRRERIRRGEYVPTKTVGITFGGRS